MAKEIKDKMETSIEGGRIKSRVNYDVVIKYDGRDCVLAPKQELPIPDFSKLGEIDPKEVIKLKA